MGKYHAYEYMFQWIQAPKKCVVERKNTKILMIFIWRRENRFFGTDINDTNVKRSRIHIHMHDCRLFYKCSCLLEIDF